MNRNRHPMSARLRYAFDNFMARGTVALIGGLFVLSLLIVVVVSGVILFSGTLLESADTEGIDTFELIWRSLLRTLDPGTMGADTGSVPFVLAMLTVTLGGIFIVATLIGVISTGIQGKIEELRKGRSIVLEDNHTVILGWSPQVFDIISEIVLANANKRKQCIVVLADRDKVEMETEIRQRLPNTRTTRVVCRSGSPIDLDDLALASLQTSRSIIVISPVTDDPDTDVIKTLLAITNDPNRRPAPYQVVTEIRDERNVEVARLASKGEAQLVLGGQLIGRIAAQTCRQPGLSIVYMELLDFGGDEIYFFQEPSLVGKTFGDGLGAFRTSSLIGIVPVGDRPHLNPQMDHVIGPDDRLIFLAEDDDTIVGVNPPDGSPREQQIVVGSRALPGIERTLVLGWNGRTPALLTELDRYVTDGSQLLVIAEGPGVADQVEAVGRRLQRLELSFRAADTTDRAVLNAATAEGYEHVVVMSYSGLLEEQRADARTLVTLLHLRDIEAQRGESFTIVSEMLDVRNRALAHVTRADDFIVSGKLVSLTMSQLAENPALSAVFDDLFDEEGSEVYLKAAGDYVRLNEPVDFYTVVESARRRGQVAFGYRLLAEADQPGKSYGVVMNPDKAAAVTFTDEDKIVVLAEG
ncbi:MAG: potassium transporter TrkA [Chloroflexota bacterium]